MTHKGLPSKSVSLISMSTLLLGMALSVTAEAAPAKPACGTHGALQVTTPQPGTYTYVRTALGSGTASFKVLSPPAKINASCDSSLPYVFGNGRSGDSIAVDVSLGSITVASAGGSPLTDAQEAALRRAIDLTPSSTQLTPPVTGNIDVILTYTNTDEVPVGEYDIIIKVNPSDASGVDSPANRTFSVVVTPPTAVDTLPPDVNLEKLGDSSTVAASVPEAPSLCLNGDYPVSLQAIDPEEGGAGTGITAIRAEITDRRGAKLVELATPATTPSLSVKAGVNVNASTILSTADIGIGQFTLATAAEDGADHTGRDQTDFNVALTVNALPPMSVAGRQFKVGSTLPIKWTFTDCAGHLLPPYDSVSLSINGDVRTVDSANNIRWELDENGNVLHYITNYTIPKEGTYDVDISVQSQGVEDSPASDAISPSSGGAALKQGSLSFQASSKGGK